MQPSIFTQIVNGDIPCHKVYEDDQVLAFLDIHPVQPGHTLIIPKKQVEFVWDLDEATYQHLMSATQRIALRLRQVMATRYVGEKIEGVDVPHAHVHLIPFDSVSQFTKAADMASQPDHELLASIAEKLRF